MISPQIMERLSRIWEGMTEAEVLDLIERSKTKGQNEKTDKKEEQATTTATAPKTEDDE